MKKITRHFKLFILFGFANLCFAYQAGAQDKDSSVVKDEMVRLLYENKPMKYVTGSVSSISGEEISDVSGSNRLNSLEGRLTGLSFINVDGLPGTENSTLRIRGVHTFGPNRDPVILIDGRVDDVTMLDPYDIEDITILKDAAAVALYGLRSSNGIILITTKKGKEGKVRVSFNHETSISEPTRMPKYLDAYNYATLYNEAMLNDNPLATPKYDATALAAYQSGSNPERYPNVNWVSEFLREYSTTTRNSINVQGGNKVAKFFVSANYLHSDGLFNTDENVNTYNTNSNVNVMNIHANVGVNISKRLSLFADIRAKKDNRNAPGAYNADYSTSIFSSLFSRPFNASPIVNTDGSIAGTQDYKTNPYGLLNYAGYSNWERSSMSTFVNLEYDLGNLLKGLKVQGKVGFNNFNDYYTNRTKNFAVYQLNPAGATYTKIGLDSELVQAGGWSGIGRNYDHSISLNYSGEFGKHNLDAFLMYDRQQVMILSTNLTQNFQGPKGSLSYRFNNKYLADFAFSYQGSEQYPESNRYGFFPVVSAGWILSNEDLLKDSKVIDFLKIRGSYGRTGNQNSSAYFDYLGSYSSVTGPPFGIAPATAVSWYEYKIANPLVTWEKCLKTNAGIDIGLFNNRLKGSFDYFEEETSDILIPNAVTSMYGATINMPEGLFRNEGYEVQAGWKDKIRDFEYFVNFNYSVARNKIVYQNEQFQNYPWMYQTGHPEDTRFGYLFDRFYTEGDFTTSGELKEDLPSQALLGTQRPGDLKYQDLNDDKKIDENDRAKIGNTKVPEIYYGVTVGFKFKGLDCNALFNGTGNSTTYNSGYTYWDFYSKIGNVAEHHLDRWTPGSGQSASYPRLTLSNTNNYQTSSFWVQDNSFIRFKYFELGYTLPVKVSKKLGMSRARIFVNGNNLYVWDNVGHKDPELRDDGLAYPIQRTFGAGVNLNF